MGINFHALLQKRVSILTSLKNKGRNKLKDHSLFYSSDIILFIHIMSIVVKLFCWSR